MTHFLIGLACGIVITLWICSVVAIYYIDLLEARYKGGEKNVRSKN